MKTNRPFLWIAGFSLTAFLSVSADPLTVTSEPFDVIAAQAGTFIFTLHPDSTGAGQTSTFTVQTLDAFGNVSNDHSGFTDILTVTGDTAFAAGFDPVNFPAPPMGVDPFDETAAEHTFTVCFRLAGTYTLTISAPGITPAEHTITVEPTILWNPLGNTSVTYMQSYSQILYAYDPVSGPVFNYSASGLPPGLSIGESFDLIDTIAASEEVDGQPSGAPRAVSVAPDGTVYFTDSENGMVRSRATDGSVTTVYHNTVSAPWGITVNDEFVFFTDAANFSVVMLDRNDDYANSALITEGLSAAFGLALDGNNLYIADTFNQRVRVYDLAGEILAEVAVCRGVSISTGSVPRSRVASATRRVVRRRTASRKRQGVVCLSRRVRRASAPMACWSSRSVLMRSI